MADPQTNGPWQGNRAIGAGEGEVPLAPPPTQNVSMRTLASDVSSIQSSGGTEPRPYTPPPPPMPRPVSNQGGPAAPSFPSGPMRGASLSPSMNPAPRPFTPPSNPPMPPRPMVPPPPPMPQPVSFSNRSEPAASAVPFQKQPMQSMGNRIPARPPSGPSGSATPPGAIAVPKKKSKGLLVVVIVLVVLALAAVGYFVVYPLLSQPGVPEVAQTPAAQEAPGTTPEQAPIVEPAAPTGEQTPPPASPTTPALHASLFTAPTDTSENITLTDVSPAGLATALGFDTAEVSIFREIVLRNQSGAPLSASGVLSALDPGTFTPEVLAMLNPDATFFTFTDTAGTWFGAVVAAAAGAGLPDLKAVVQRIEVSASQKNFFLSDPGTPGTWKSGAAEGVGNRYAAFSRPGFALNYGWKGNTLVISSSYEGFKEALRRL